MRPLARAASAFAALCVVGVGVVYAVGYRSAIGRRDDSRQSFAASQVNAGERLATAANCAACHSQPDGRPYAGGLPIATSFGVIYASNITPDPDAGIGRWSLEAFTRAMREGVARSGAQLYPAFPYDHYTKLDDEDVAAIYAYLMTRDAVSERPARTSLHFPFNIRPLMGAWKLLFLDKARFARDEQKSDEWNRGAYLAQALGHCGSCHTPRNVLGAEKRSQMFDGGEVGGWWAPPLNANSPALTPWTVDSLYNYLRSWDSVHGGAVGPMAEVTASLQRLPEADVRAIATYVADMMKGAKDRAGEVQTFETRSFDAAGDQGLLNGERIFSGACATCHESKGAVPFTTYSLAQHTALQGPDPSNVSHVVMQGINPPEGAPGGIMPGFRAVLNDEQTADLLGYLRKRYTDQQPWPETAAAIRAARASTEGRSAATR